MTTYMYERTPLYHLSLCSPTSDQQVAALIMARMVNQSGSAAPVNWIATFSSIIARPVFTTICKREI